MSMCKNYSLTYIITHVFSNANIDFSSSWLFFFLQEVRITTIEVVHCWTMLAVWENDKGASPWALPVEYGYHWCSWGYGMYVLPGIHIFLCNGSYVSWLIQKACTEVLLVNRQCHFNYVNIAVMGQIFFDKLMLSYLSSNLLFRL